MISPPCDTERRLHLLRRRDRRVVVGAQAFSQSRLDVAAGQQDRVAHQHGRARGRRLLVVGHDGRVAADHRHVFDGCAQLIGSDLGKDGLAALPDVLRSGVDDDRPIRQQPDDRLRKAGGGSRLDAECEAAAAALRLWLVPLRQLGGAADRVRPLAVGRGVERDELVAAVGDVAQADVDLVDARAVAASEMFDSTAQLICGLPKPRNAVDGTVCERTVRARMRAAGQLYGPLPM